MKKIYVPRWIHTQGASPLLCMLCKNFTEDAWLWYSEPTVSTACVCDECAQEIGR
jgi:hypothetical protein